MAIPTRFVECFVTRQVLLEPFVVMRRRNTFALLAVWNNLEHMRILTAVVFLIPPPKPSRKSTHRPSFWQAACSTLESHISPRMIF